MTIVEIAEGIEQRLLVIGFLHHFQEREQGVAESLGRQPVRRLNIYHGNKVLLFRNTLRHKVLQLLTLFRLGTIEMIAAHLQPMNMGHHYVLLKLLINTVTTFRSLQIDISHTGIVTNGLPEHVALVVAHINAVNMRTGVLA